MRPTPRVSRPPATASLRRPSTRLSSSLSSWLNSWLSTGLAAGVALALVLGLAGCTGDSDGDGDGGSTPLPSGSSAGVDLPTAAPVRVQVKTVWGRWPERGSKQSDQLAKRAGSAVTDWIDTAFLDLDYPTKGGAGPDTDVGAAFATFTSGAAEQARRQVDLTTNVTAGRDLVDVVATRRVVQLIGYAPRGTAVGATAVVQLVMVGATDDGARAEIAVTGELYLTRAGNGWRVFGYDLQRSTGAPGAYARAHRRDDRSGKPDGAPGNGNGGRR